MKVSRDKIEALVRHRYSGGTHTERQIEGMIATVQAVLDVTEKMAGWSAAEIHAIASAACQAQIYEESGDRRMKRAPTPPQIPIPPRTMRISDHGDKKK